MKKLIMIAGLVILSSCEGDLKCDNEQALETVEQLVFGHHKKECEKTIKNGGHFGPLTNKSSNTPSLKKHRIDMSKQELKSIESIKFVNILTTNINEELKSCGCEASIKLASPMSYYSTIYRPQGVENGDKFYYNIKTNSKGELIIEVLNP